MMEAAAVVEQSYGCMRGAAVPAMDHSSSADGWLSHLQDPSPREMTEVAAGLGCFKR